MHFEFWFQMITICVIAFFQHFLKEIKCVNWPLFYFEGEWWIAGAYCFARCVLLLIPFCILLRWSERFTMFSSAMSPLPAFLVFRANFENMTITRKTEDLWKFELRVNVYRIKLWRYGRMLLFAQQDAIAEGYYSVLSSNWSVPPSQLVQAYICRLLNQLLKVNFFYSAIRILKVIIIFIIFWAQRALTYRIKYERQKYVIRLLKITAFTFLKRQDLYNIKIAHVLTKSAKIIQYFRLNLNRLVHLKCIASNKLFYA